MARTPRKREIFVQGDSVYVYLQQENKYVAISANDLVDAFNQPNSSGGIDAGDLERLQSQVMELQQKLLQVTEILDAVIPI